MESAELIERVAARHGLPVGRVSAPLLPGKVNDTVVIRHPDQSWVLRTGDGPYETEAWCSAAAQASGILTPRVVATGELDGQGYHVQELIEPGAHPDVDDDAHWVELGRLITAISQISLVGAPEPLFSRFGQDADHAWRSHLAYNLAELTPDDRLLDQQVYQPGDRAWIAARFVALTEQPFRQGLFHGDLCWRNLVVSTSGDTWVIDWGSAQTGPVPAAELVHLRLNAETTEGISLERLHALEAQLGQDAAVLDNLELLGAIDLVRWAIDRNPARLLELATRARRVVDRLRPR